MKTFVEGNLEDKYNTKNPVSKILVQGFLRSYKHSLNEIKKEHKIKTICEVGVGEGELLKIASQVFPKAKIYATDLSRNQINEAKDNLKKLKVIYSVQNAHKLDKYKNNQFDLVICCEVLEHLDYPEKGLLELNRISKGVLLVSVPNEPIWRILNLARGKYIRRFGNTPGHFNHWTIIGFRRFIRRHFSIKLSLFPFPWQMKVLTKKQETSQEKGGLLSSFLKEKRYDAALSEMRNLRNSLILDIGCGEGGFMDYSCIRDKNYFGVDIQRYWSEDRKNLFVTDITKSIPKPISNKKFDYIIVLALIEHIKNPQRLLKRLAPLLGERGKIIITTPAPSGRKTHDIGASMGLFSKEAAKEHEKFLGREDIENMVVESGLKLSAYKRFLFRLNQLAIITK